MDKEKLAEITESLNAIRDKQIDATNLGISFVHEMDDSNFFDVISAMLIELHKQQKHDSSMMQYTHQRVYGAVIADRLITMMPAIYALFDRLAEHGEKVQIGDLDASVWVKDNVLAIETHCGSINQILILHRHRNIEGLEPLEFDEFHVREYNQDKTSMTMDEFIEYHSSKNSVTAEYKIPEPVYWPMYGDCRDKYSGISLKNMTSDVNRPTAEFVDADMVLRHTLFNLEWVIQEVNYELDNEN